MRFPEFRMHKKYFYLNLIIIISLYLNIGGFIFRTSCLPLPVPASEVLIPKESVPIITMTYRINNSLQFMTIIELEL